MYQINTYMCMTKSRIRDVTDVVYKNDVYSENILCLCSTKYVGLYFFMKTELSENGILC